MNEIFISNPDISPICRTCGMENSTKDGTIIECDHLFYAGISEVEEPLFIRTDILEGYYNSEKYSSPYFYLKEILDDSYLCLISGAPAPSALEVYFVYKL
jgi:hypothetical protein